MNLCCMDFPPVLKLSVVVESDCRSCESHLVHTDFVTVMLNQILCSSQVVIQGSDDIATRAIDLLKEIYTNLGPKLQVNQVTLPSSPDRRTSARRYIASDLLPLPFTGRDP